MCGTATSHKHTCQTFTFCTWPKHDSHVNTLHKLMTSVALQPVVLAILAGMPCGVRHCRQQAKLTSARVLSMKALIPKSVILASPCRLSSTFAGLMSLCTCSLRISQAVLGKPAQVQYMPPLLASCLSPEVCEVQHSLLSCAANAIENAC